MATQEKYTKPDEEQENINTPSKEGSTKESHLSQSLRTDNRNRDRDRGNG